MLSLLFILFILVEMIYGKCWVLNNKELNYINSNNCVSSTNGIDISNGGYLRFNNNYKESSITINDYSDSDSSTWYIQSSEELKYLTKITLNLYSSSHNYRFYQIKASNLLKLDINSLSNTYRSKLVHVYVSTDMEIEQLFNKDNVINFYFYSSEYYTLIIMEKDVYILYFN